MRAVSGVTQRAQAGLSLVELMVAMVLGLLLLGAVFQVYLSTKLTFAAQDQKSALEEGGRFAIEQVARDVRMAGLTGCNSRTMPGGQPVSGRNHLNGATAFPFLFIDPIRGLEANDSLPGAILALTDAQPAVGGTWNEALPAPVAASAIPGSDILLVSGMGAQSWPLIDPFASGAQIFVQPGNDIAIGDLLFVTDCSQGFVFQATNVAAAGGKTNVTGSAGGTVSPGNATPIAAQGPNGGAFRSGAAVARASSVAYFVGRSSGGTPSLFRASLLAPAGAASQRSLQVEEMIGGVESMQLTYGVDADGNFSVDGYHPATAVADWTQVRSVRVGLLLRGDEASLASTDSASYSVAGTTINPTDDRRQRRVFEMTVSLRNRLP